LAYQDFCKKAPKDVIIMLMIIFGDGTVIDGAIRSPWSHILLHLGYSGSVRGLPIMWCNLGYIKNKTNCLFILRSNKRRIIS